MEIRKQYFKEKQYMWHKVRELQLKGLNKTQIGIYLGVNRKTVRRYLNMTMEEFVKKQSSHRKTTSNMYVQTWKNTRIYQPPGYMTG